MLTQAIVEGAITDGRGKRLYLSDTVVLLTAAVTAESGRPIGFRRDEAPVQRRSALDVAAVLGEPLAAQVDLACTDVLRSDVMRRRWIQESLLADLSDRYRKHGVDLHWDESFVQWLLDRYGSAANRRDWERVMDESLGPLLVPHLPSGAAGKAQALVIRCKDGTVHVERQMSSEGGP